MEFARKQLEKYGWKEGEGLGKNKSGISKAIRPKLKFDACGLGHDAFEDLNNAWWRRLYDEAAKNLVTRRNADDSVTVETADDSLEITTRKKKSKKRKRSAEAVYENFVKTSELNDDVEKKIVEEEEDEADSKRSATGGICDVTDEELFRICGGRTAHKGARHGLNMNAKLARVEKQENGLMIMGNCSDRRPGEKQPRKSHKSKKRKEK